MKYPDFATHWVRKLGGKIEDLAPLRGGINNQVFLCRAQQCSCVIKGYPSQKPSQRDRMQAEVDFLRYSAHVAPGFTPALIEADAERRCVVLEYIEGTVYPEGAYPRQKDIEAAFRFFRMLNDQHELARKMIRQDAAEGFLTLRQHMENLHERLSAMETEHLPRQHKGQAKKLLQELYAKAEDVVIEIEDQIRSGIIEDGLNPDHCCVSPSDFGFHNAICSANQVRFIDFEFAGWDDPAKSCADFILQQRNPIALDPVDIASKFIPKKEAILGSRISAMTEILRVKWLCIILGILNPAKLVKVLEVEPSLTQESVVATQLKRYHEYMEASFLHQPP